MLVTAGREAIQLWDAASGGELASYPGIRDVSGLAASPDGSLLAAGVNLGVKVLSAADGRGIDTLLGTAVAVQSAAFSPDGKTLAAGGQNVITWEWPGGREIANVKIDPWATHLAFTPDGKALAVATHTGVKIYEAPNLRLLRSIGEEEPTAVALSPDGKLLAWAARGSPIRLVDLANGKEVGTLTGHTDEVGALAFSPDGARLASAGLDSTIRFWGVGQ
jgi:WD40 repeat protein